MTKGCKIWFGFVMVVYAITALFSVLLMSSYPVGGLIGLVNGIVVSAGAGIVLFKNEKTGFYIIAGMEAALLVLSLLGAGNIAVAIVSAIPITTISYIFFNKNIQIIR